ncbi:MAG: ETC complex I subunit [Micavibrio aeruginosavorus]|uniref:ETC complex I subunit n=1 Tax=Micavibrio aeruginosavorus TaxID=349221 RepID=A0A7T5UH04_9BACT|nr:MAG: ETC complex I subunit [Micavibrio aeruginosavorus]
MTSVRIYKPAKSAMQSGRAKGQRWILETETETSRRPEDLMGWVSSGDTLNQVRLAFDTLEDAIAHAQARGWDYSVSAPQQRKLRPRNYTDNFRYIPAEKRT